MINTCKILRVIAIRTYWAEQLIFGQKWEFQPNTYEIVRIGHSYVLGSNMCCGCHTAAPREPIGLISRVLQKLQIIIEQYCN